MTRCSLFVRRFNSSHAARPDQTYESTHMHAFSLT